MTSVAVAGRTDFGDSGEAVQNLASIWRRLAGYLLNFALLCFSGALAGVLFGILSALTGTHAPHLLLVALALAPFMVWFYKLAEFGQTPGKALLGLRVYSDISGDAVGRKRMFAREFGLPVLIVLVIYGLWELMNLALSSRGLSGYDSYGRSAWSLRSSSLRDLWLILLYPLLWLPELLILRGSRKRLVDEILGTHVRYEPEAVAHHQVNGEVANPSCSVSPQMRVAALRSMRGLGGTGVIERLITGLFDPVWFVRCAAVEEIRYHAENLDEAGLLYAQALRDRDRRVVEAAVVAAGALRHPGAVTELHNLLRSGDLAIRRRAVAALGEIRDLSSVAALTALLGDLMREQPVSALLPDIIDALGRFGAAARPAVPLLGACISNRYSMRDDSRPAVLALLNIGGDEARAILEEILADATHPANHAVRDIIQLNGHPR